MILFYYLLGELYGGGDFFGVVGVIRVDIVGDFFKAAADARETVGDSDKLVQVGAGDMINGGDSEGGVIAADRPGEGEAGNFGNILQDVLALGAEGREGVEIILGGGVGVGVVVGH